MKPKNIAVFLSLTLVLAILLTAFLPIAVSASTDSYIELSKSSGSTGTSISINGYDFSEGYFYYIFFDGVYKSKGNINDDGEFVKTFIIPSSANVGETYEIAVFASESAHGDPEYDDGYDESAYADFDVTEIYIELDSENGKTGDSIEIYGYGFSVDYYYYVFFDETYKSKGTIDENGEFTQTLTIPSSVDAGKEYEIKVFASESNNSSPTYTDDYNESTFTDFQVDEAEPFLEINIDSGNVGDAFNLGGSDFGAEKTITVYWDETKIGPVFNASSNGDFSDREFIVPETPYGIHTVKVINSAGAFYTLSYFVDPKINLSSTSVTGGNSITVSGTGFEASSQVIFYLDSTALDTTGKTSSTGTLKSTSILIPDSEDFSGSHFIEVQDAAGNSASMNIEISPPTPVVPSTQPETVPAVQTSPVPAVTDNPGPNNPALTPDTSVSTQASSKSAAPANNQPGQANQPQQPPGSPSGFPVWAIVLIGIAAIIIILLVVLLVARRRNSNN
jgi:hypothetical protein